MLFYNELNLGATSLNWKSLACEFQWCFWHVSEVWIGSLPVKLSVSDLGKLLFYLEYTKVQVSTIFSGTIVLTLPYSWVTHGGDFSMAECTWRDSGSVNTVSVNLRTTSFTSNLKSSMFVIHTFLDMPSLTTLSWVSRFHDLSYALTSCQLIFHAFSKSQTPQKIWSCRVRFQVKYQ